MDVGLARVMSIGHRADKQVDLRGFCAFRRVTEYACCYPVNLHILHIIIRLHHNVSLIDWHDRTFDYLGRQKEESFCRPCHLHQCPNP